VFFKDNCHKYSRVFFIKQKNRVSKHLCTFLNEVSSAGHRIKMFWYYSGMEFACKDVHRVLSDHGITLLLSEPYAPEQNEVSERESHTVLELARSMLLVSRLPKLMWAQAYETAVYVLYRTGKISVIGKSPMEMWNGHMMKNLDHLCVFGVECFVYTSKQFQKIFDKKSAFGRFIGYLNDNDVYKFTCHLSKRLCTCMICTSS